ncbi:hypothetical protein [Nocardioides ultimimeridianus]
MSRTPSFADLVDWVEGRLDEDRAALVAAHVRADGAAADAVAWIRDFGQAAAALPLVEPPAELRDRLRALFPAGRAGTADWSVARLLHDTAEGRIAGARLDAGAGERYLAFEAAEGRFVLEVRRSASPAAVDLYGLVLLDDVTGGGSVTVTEGGVARRMAPLGAHGRFELLDVPLSADEIRISVGDVRLSADLGLQ